MMALRTWITWVKEFARGRQANELSSIEPQEQFHATIRRERVGADRNQHVFSLLLFNIGDPKANSVEVQHLAHVLANRIRSTDEVGWFYNKHIGVLLRYTSTDGAQKLADDICQAIAAKALPPEYTIYSYPLKRFSNGNGHSGQLHFSDISGPNGKQQRQRASLRLPNRTSTNIHLPVQSEFPQTQRTRARN